jgi:hypothetical protein
MQPTYGTYGQTGTEVLVQQMAYAQASNINEKQEMKPADDDPFRMYWVREHDGTWTQRNRMTIDSGDIGDCRWYAMEGQFYAVRLATGSMRIVFWAVEWYAYFLVYCLGTNI